MHSTIAVTGATGLIGRKIVSILSGRGDKVIVLTRSSRKASEIFNGNIELIEWDYKNITPTLIHILSNAESIIHLAGENVLKKRWSDAHKQNIYSSRINSTRLLTSALLQSTTRPSVFVSASAVGYYGLTSDKPADEKSECGTDFLAMVVKDWENGLLPIEEAGVRSVKIRTGIVLDREDGALAKMILPFKFYLGGPLGSGKQPFPWVHIDDAAKLFVYALDNNSMTGSYNAVAPQNITMKQFCKSLGGVMKRPSIFKVPSLALRILYGEGADILLNGVNIIPKRTLESGFEFSYKDSVSALRSLL